MSISNIIEIHRREQMTEDISAVQVIRVNHTSLWEDACAHFLIPFNYSEHLQIEFVGEEGIDGGGLSREFFSLLMQSADELLEGPPNNKVFRHNLLALKAYKFKAFGIIVALSIMNGGPVPTYFALPLLRYLTEGFNVTARIDDVPDLSIREKIREVLVTA